VDLEDEIPLSPPLPPPLFSPPFRGRGLRGGYSPYTTTLTFHPLPSRERRCGQGIMQGEVEKESRICLRRIFSPDQWLFSESKLHLKYL